MNVIDTISLSVTSERYALNDCKHTESERGCNYKTTVELSLTGPTLNSGPALDHQSRFVFKTNYIQIIHKIAHAIMFQDLCTKKYMKMNDNVFLEWVESNLLRLKKKQCHHFHGYPISFDKNRQSLD